jgi:hypothetical protein
LVSVYSAFPATLIRRLPDDALPLSYSRLILCHPSAYLKNKYKPTEKYYQIFYEKTGIIGINPLPVDMIAIPRQLFVKKGNSSGIRDKIIS